MICFYTHWHSQLVYHWKQHKYFVTNHLSPYVRTIYPVWIGQFWLICYFYALSVRAFSFFFDIYIYVNLLVRWKLVLTSSHAISAIIMAHDFFDRPTISGQKTSINRLVLRVALTVRCVEICRYSCLKRTRFLCLPWRCSTLNRVDVLPFNVYIYSWHPSYVAPHCARIHYTHFKHIAYAVYPAKKKMKHELCGGRRCARLHKKYPKKKPMEWNRVEFNRTSIFNVCAAIKTQIIQEDLTHVSALNHIEQQQIFEITYIYIYKCIGEQYARLGTKCSPHLYLPL